MLLGTAQNLRLVQVGSRYTLSCAVAIPDTPDGDSVAWFDIVDPGPAAAAYRLCVFPGDAVPPPSAQIQANVQERVDSAAATNGVRVLDEAGTHLITL